MPKNKRGASHTLFIILTIFLKDLEGEAGGLKTNKQMLPKLTDLETKFRVHHHDPINLTGYNGSFTKEQEVFDSSNDQIA